MISDICGIIKFKCEDVCGRISLLLLYNNGNGKRDRGIIFYTSCLGVYLNKKEVKLSSIVPLAKH